MKRWVFLFMASMLGLIITGCNSNPSTTTNVTTNPTSTLPPTSGGTISETTLYLVEFDSKGGSEVSEQGIFKGELVIEPTVSKTGYSLDGWYLSNDGGVTFIKKWNFASDTVTKNLILYAVWIINQYTITFISNGGLGVDPITQDYGSVIEEVIPIRFNYQFDGWYLDEGLTNSYNLTTMPANNITLYAKWSPVVNTFELHYYLLPEGFNPITDDIVIQEPKFIDISITSNFTVALTEDHQVYAWGYNEYYQLGNGQIANRTIPTNITSYFNLDESDYIVEIETGYMHSLALTHLGKVYAWGDNEDGSLGTGDTDIYKTPVEITDNFDLLPSEQIVKIDCGNYHSAALTSLGRLFMWGDNSAGQLGTDEFGDTTLPIDITDVFSLNIDEVITTTALGGNHSLALTSEARVFSWGFNIVMQLGDGTNLNRTTPLDITDNFALGIDEEIIKIVGGNNHSGAVTNQGNVFTFGHNSYGQLGDGTETNQGIPVKITNQFGLEIGETITDLFMGVTFSSAITSNQRIFTWGLNETGQLGDESFLDSSTPIDISDLFEFNEANEIITLSLGNAYISVLDEAGKIYLWGDNYQGQLGIGSYIDEITPQNPMFWIPEIIIMTYNEGENYNLYLPERYDDIFIGWFIDLGLSQQFDFLINPDGPTILYSKWESFPAILLQRSEFLEPDGYHYYSFTITATSSITIYTTGDLDTYGVLMDEEENIIIQNDDGDIDYNFYISYTLDPGTYTIEVSGYDETETGPYELYVIKN